MRGRPGSRFHLAVDANGAPLAIRIGAGNENERAHLLPLVDELQARGRKPGEVWADRGYASAALAQALRDRAIEPRISKPRRPGEPIPDGVAVTEIWRGRRRRLKSRDPQARHRWPVERTNSWLRAWRRVDVRWERRPELWLAVIQTAAAITLYNQLDSFR